LSFFAEEGIRKRTEISVNNGSCKLSGTQDEAELRATMKMFNVRTDSVLTKEKQKNSLSIYRYLFFIGSIGDQRNPLCLIFWVLLFYYFVAFKK